MRKDIKVLRNMMTVLLVVSVVVSAYGLYLVFESNEKETEETVGYKYYSEVYVGNDNPTISHIYYDICERFPETKTIYSLNSFIKEVRSINDLSGDMIKYGEMIVVPYYSDEFH